MSYLISNKPMSLTQIIGDSIKFIVQQLGWILPIAFAGIFGVLFAQDWMANHEPSSLGMQGAIQITEIVVFSFITGIVTVFLGKSYCGESVSVEDALQITMKRLTPLVLLRAAVAISIILGTVLFIVPGMIILAATTCAVPAMMLEDLGFVQAFKRSWALTSKNRLRIFGYLIVSLLCVFIPAFCFAIIGELLTEYGIINWLVKLALLSVVLAPFEVLNPVVAAFIFLKLREEKDTGKEESLVAAA